MYNSIDLFFEEMLKMFPQTIQEYDAHIREYDGRLDSVVIEDIIMPEIIKVIRTNDEAMLVRLFDYLEEISLIDDAYLINLLTISVLEKIGDEKNIFNNAKRFMGEKTKSLQIRSDIGLGRIRYSDGSLEKT